MTLPPLPEPTWGYSTSTPKFSAAQMQEYARAALAQQPAQDWSLLEATQESLREHMAEIQTLRAALARQPLTDAEAVALLERCDDEAGEVESMEAAMILVVRAIEAAHGITARVWTSEEVDAAVDRALEAVHGIKE